MSKKQNIQWIITTMIMVVLTVVLYIRYDIEHKKAIETDVPSSSVTGENRKKQVLPSSEVEKTSEESTSESEADTASTVSESSEEMVESADMTESKVALDSKLKAEDIYNLDLMKEDGIELLKLDQYKNTANVIDRTLAEFNVNSSEISLAYYDFQNDEHYYINGDTFLTAASIAKVHLAALYIDELEQGEITLSTELAYSDKLFEEGAGKVTNQPSKATYTVDELLTEAIIHSDNTAMNILKKAYEDEHGNYRESVLDFVGLDADKEIYQEYLNSNVGSAHLIEQVLIKIATDDTYQDLIDLMTQTTPTQLFTRYVTGDRMANKFGRFDKSVNDCGIYYENGQPQYALIVLTDNVEDADHFLEVMNLRVNQWFRHKYL